MGGGRGVRAKWKPIVCPAVRSENLDISIFFGGGEVKHLSKNDLHWSRKISEILKPAKNMFFVRLKHFRDGIM